MRLKKAQRQALLEWVAEGLQSDEINLQAKEFDPPFSLSRATITHYRKTRAVDIQRVISEGEHEALSTGLALTSERVKKLKALALRLERDLFGDGIDDYVWTDQVKGVGSGLTAEVVEYEEFNSAEIAAYRLLLDDIAKETGGRVQKSDITSGGEKIAFVNVGVDLDKI